MLSTRTRLDQTDLSVTLVGMLKAGPKDQGAQFMQLPQTDTAVEWTALTQGPLYRWQAPNVDLLTGPGRPRVAYVQVPRKNGKSRLAASVALHDCGHGKQVFLVADSRDSLNLALFNEIRTLIRKSPVLSAAMLTYKDHIECPGTGGNIYILANNVEATQSINPDTVIVDEVHLQKNDQLWNGAVLATAAMPDPLVLGITTPGYDVTSHAHDLYQQVKAGSLWGMIYEPSNPDCELEDLDSLVEANPILLSRPEMLEVFAFEREKLPEHDYRRFRLGQWTTAATAWLPYGRWDALRVARELQPGEKIWLGFDGSFSGDSTGLVAVTSDGFVQVIACWESPGVKGWRVPRDQVLDKVAETFELYDVQAMFCDPPYWQREIIDWDRKYPGKVIEFPTFSRARMAPACTTFYTAVLEGKLSHNGDDRLRRHIGNTVVQSSPQGDFVTKQHKDSPAKIDLAIAAIIAVAHARLAVPTRTVPVWVI